MTEEELHLLAASYANSRKIVYVERMNKGKVRKHSEDILNWVWLAHYEGYKEGYWSATGNNCYSTNPTKAQEDNND